MTSTSKKTSSKEMTGQHKYGFTSIFVFFIQLTDFRSKSSHSARWFVFFYRPPLTTNKDNSPATRQVRSFELLDRIMACFFCRWGLLESTKFEPPKPGRTGTSNSVVQVSGSYKQNGAPYLGNLTQKMER